MLIWGIPLYMRFVFWMYTYPPPMGILLRYVEFDKDCVSRTTMGFSGKQHLKQNVNLPGYTLASAAPPPSYKPQITALQADFSHFSGVVIKMITESITSPK